MCHLPVTVTVTRISHCWEGPEELQGGISAGDSSLLGASA